MTPTGEEMTGLLTRFRIRHALKHGRREHRYGRLQFVPVVICLILAVMDFRYSILSLLWFKYPILLFKAGFLYIVLLSTTLLFQALYLVNHHLEKLWYGKRGFR